MDIAIGTGFKHEFRHCSAVVPSVHYGKTERGYSHSFGFFGIGSVFQQPLHNFGLLVIYGVMKGNESFMIFRVGIGAVVEEKFHDFGLAAANGRVQPRSIVLISRIDIDSVADRLFDKFGIAVFDCAENASGRSRATAERIIADFRHAVRFSCECFQKRSPCLDRTHGRRFSLRSPGWSLQSVPCSP